MSPSKHRFRTLLTRLTVSYGRRCMDEPREEEYEVPIAEAEEEVDQGDREVQSQGG